MTSAILWAAGLREQVGREWERSWVLQFRGSDPLFHSFGSSLLVCLPGWLAVCGTANASFHSFVRSFVLDLCSHSATQYIRHHKNVLLEAAECTPPFPARGWLS